MAAAAQPCPGNSHALGTARVLAVGVKSMPRVGRKQFPATLPLKDKELVLTFDDGPWPTTTPKVLDALRRECVRATFFLLGRNVAAHPAIARRELAEGHSIGHHSYSHPLLNRMALGKAEAEINRGIAADELALYGKRRSDPTSPFFRFPGFASSPALLDYVNGRGMVVFGADVWASDWLPQTPEQELHLLLTRIAQGRPRHRAAARHQGADRPHAAGPAAGAEAARLPDRPRRAGRPCQALNLPSPAAGEKATVPANSEKATENKAVARSKRLILG